MSRQLVRWETAWFADGNWVTSDKKQVVLKGNFFAIYEGKRILVVMSSHYCPAGHGEPSYTYRQPNYLDAETLEDLSLSGVYIEVEENARLPAPSKKYLLFVDLTYLAGALPVEGEFATMQELLDYVQQAQKRDSWDWLFIVNVEAHRSLALVSSHTPFAELSLATPGLADL